jgi:hypothetical protein
VISTAVLHIFGVAIGAPYTDRNEISTKPADARTAQPGFCRAYLSTQLISTRCEPDPGEMDLFNPARGAAIFVDTPMRKSAIHSNRRT